MTTQEVSRIDEVIDYISKGNIGCTFAAVAARNPERYDWGFYEVTYMEQPMPKHYHSTVSIIFPDTWKAQDVKVWCLRQGMTEVVVTNGTWWNRLKRWFTGEKLIGLRYEQDGYPAYVMYMGQDSHCPTRKTPHPIITFRSKRPLAPFYRVGFSGVLHIAQMFMDIAQYKMEKLWESSHRNSKRIVGKPLNEEHAAKTTFKE